MSNNLKDEAMKRIAGDSAQQAEPDEDDEGSEEAVMPVHWDLFPGWLIDHHEGDVITEELLQFALADMLKVHPAAPAPASPAALPERDTSKPAEQQGLFRKFDVRRTDGSDAPGGKHHGCRYFVLDVDHDAHAAAALGAYAAACEATHPDLARDLREKWGASPADQVEDARDAARYRWLRENTDDQIPYRGWWQIAGGAGADPSKLDAVIDAAIQKEVA